MDRVVLAHGLVGLADLGLGAPFDPWVDPAAPLDERGAEELAPTRLLRRSRGYLCVRLPLPGSPDECGRLTGRPGPAGTGWIVLERWSGGSLRALCRARFTAPRSASSAERRWNLLCYLLAHGVGTPEPLAVGARGRGLFAAHSFLVTRELTNHAPLSRWLADVRAPEARGRGLTALASALTRLFAAGVRPAALRPEDLCLSAPEATPARACAPAGPVPGLRVNRLPGVAVVELLRARLGTPLAPSRRRALLDGLTTPLVATRLLEAEEATRLRDQVLGDAASAVPA